MTMVAVVWDRGEKETQSTCHNAVSLSECASIIAAQLNTWNGDKRKTNTLIVSIGHRGGDAKMFQITPTPYDANPRNIIWNDYAKSWGPGGNDEEIIEYITSACDD